MSIPDLGKKIKGSLPKALFEGELLLVLIIALSAVASFGLGRLSVQNNPKDANVIINSKDGPVTPICK